MLYLAFGVLLSALVGVIAAWRWSQTHSFRAGKTPEFDSLAAYAETTAKYSLPNYVPDDIMELPQHTVRGWRVPS